MVARSTEQNVRHEGYNHLAGHHSAVYGAQTRTG